MATLLTRLLGPVSRDDEDRRKEYILNVILVFSIIFVLLTLFVSLTYMASGIVDNVPDPGGDHPFILIGFLVFFSVLLFLSKRGHYKTVSYVLIYAFLIPLMYANITWGVDLPQAMGTYALVIIVASILVNPKFSFFITILIALFMTIVGYLQIKMIISPDFYWRTGTFSMLDIAMAIVTFAIIVAISWLSNREINRSLKRARLSEAKLQKERDLLEVKVVERTKDLQKVQNEKIKQIEKFATIGKLASGILHDLANPLGSILLGLENIKINKKAYQQIKNSVNQLEASSTHMKRLLVLFRQQVDEKDRSRYFSPEYETRQALEALKFKINQSGVESIEVKVKQKIKIFGNPLKYNQLVSNLVSNAIDAYKDINKSMSKIEIALDANKKVFTLSIKDYAIGIKKDQQKSVFEPFSSTKNDGNLGLGLSISKGIVKEHFKGSITVESEVGKWTEFVVEIPFKKRSEQ